MEQSKNAIIVIGNGFDLAHELKTAYNDFAQYYLKEVIIKNLIENPFNTIFSKEMQIAYGKEEDGDTLNLSSNNASLVRSLVYTRERNKEKIVELLNSPEIIKFTLKNTFLIKLYANSYGNWFDIEQAYYDELIGFYKNSRNNYVARKLVIKLNNELNEIKEALRDYLLKHAMKDKMFDCVIKFFDTNFKGIENFYIVNFNYTQTIEKYFTRSTVFQDAIENNLLDINYIHGRLLDNYMVFGYGDDTDKTYKDLKDTKINDYLENFKTFKYIEEINYNKVINAIESFKDYEVYNLGHSFGMTDKTILKKIIDDEKCKYIHLYKIPTIDEDDKIKELKKLHYSIARILPVDDDVRNKVVPIKITNHFPYGIPEIENSINPKDVEKIKDFHVNEIELLTYKKNILYTQRNPLKVKRLLL